MAISKKTYVLVSDGAGNVKAVVQDGKQTGTILVGEGGTIDDAVAKQYGVQTTDKGNDVGPISGTSGTNTDALAAGVAADAADASAGGTSPLLPTDTPAK